MKKIPLTQGKEALVDDRDYDWLMQWKWHVEKHVRKVGVLWYASRTGLRTEPRHKKTIMLHREIALRSGLPYSRNYDHRDGDGLNNQRENIRACTQAQNNANQRKTIGTSSCFKGVRWCNQQEKWRAEICVSGKRLYLGRFDSEQDAYIAYSASAQKHFGQFASINR